MTLENFLNGKHTFTTINDMDWTYNGENCYIKQSDIVHLLIESKIKVLNTNDIGWKWEDLDIDSKEGIDKLNTDRYKNVDMSYKPIVIKNGPNPKKKLYRLIDGCHRMLRMKVEGITENSFYVLENDEIKEFLHYE